MAEATAHEFLGLLCLLIKSLLHTRSEKSKFKMPIIKGYINIGGREF